MCHIRDREGGRGGGGGAEKTCVFQRPTERLDLSDGRTTQDGKVNQTDGDPLVLQVLGLHRTITQSRYLQEGKVTRVAETATDVAALHASRHNGL